MVNYVVGEVRYEDDQLVEVSIQCFDEPDGPFLYECEVVPVDEVVRRIKRGDKVVAFWPGVGSLPVEIVR
jgi:hypothetical protein